MVKLRNPRGTWLAADTGIRKYYLRQSDPAHTDL